MPVDQARYRRFAGELHPRRGAWRAIATTAIRRVMRRFWIRTVTGIIVLINVGVASFMTFMVNTKIVGGRSISDMTEAQGLGAIDSLGLSLGVTLVFAGMWAPIIAALTVAPLIAEDRRARALPLYFCRPIRHLDYVAGKVLAGLFFLGLISLVPAVFVLAVDLGYATEEIDWGHKLRLTAGVMLPLAALTLVLTLFSLAVSSLVERKNAASLSVFGGLLLVGAVSLILSRLFESTAWMAMNPVAAAQTIGADALPSLAGGGTNLPSVDLTVASIPVVRAWMSLACWGGVSLLVLFWRIRKVEVVQ
jgi:ABC-type transport system involved in multi-copper enzyme maturation permease subunit